MVDSRGSDQDQVEFHVDLDDLACPISLQLMESPVIATCGHAFDRDNLAQWQERQAWEDGQCQCPSCKRLIRSEAAVKVPMLDRLLQKIREAYPQQESGTVAVSLNLRDISCPISGQPLVMPIVARCGHILDMASVFEYKRTHGGVCPCPGCVARVEAVVATPIVIRKLLSSLYCEHPDLLFPMLDSALSNGVETNRIKKHLLCWFAEHSEQVEDGLNVVATRSGFQGETAASLLVRYRLDLLVGDAKLCSRLSERGLNAIAAADRLSGAWLLVSTPEGLRLVDKNAELRSKLKAGLNTAPVEGECAGITGVCWLAGMSDLLTRYSELSDAVTAEGLNTANRVVTTRGASALYWLATTESGCQLIIQDEALRAKITAKGLNTAYQGAALDNSAIDPCVSPLRLLIEDPDGITLFSEDKVLCGKVTEAGLNAVDAEGISVLILLASSPRGRQLLSDDAILRAKISAAGLNAKVSLQGPVPGMSAAAYLAITPEGQTLLLNNPRLCDLIEQGVFLLEVPGKGKTVRELMQATENGRALLQQHPRWQRSAAELNSGRSGLVPRLNLAAVSQLGAIAAVPPLTTRRDRRELLAPYLLAPPTLLQPSAPPESAIREVMPPRESSPLAAVPFYVGMRQFTEPSAPPQTPTPDGGRKKGGGPMPG